MESADGNGHEPATKADVAAVSGDVAAVSADVAAVSADVAAVSADVAAVSADVAALRAEVKADVAALRAEVSADVGALKANLTAVEERVIETMRDIQTEMLKAFYAVAESNHKRLTEGERQAEALKKAPRYSLESRVLSVEKRLNVPPAA